MNPNTYFVYILTNKNKTVLYTGVTDDLKRRVYEHKTKINKGFTDKYNVDCLVYFESFSDIKEAITREKRLKDWRREWKEKLINQFNPEWRDLFEEI
ncbi:MAG TPA: GIY-YIG nuclease family protein [Bacteroidales bacterium]|nr:GIY-YIG nuclease family protein [Bacteroidales bacterium]